LFLPDMVAVLRQGRCWSEDLYEDSFDLLEVGVLFVVVQVRGFAQRSD